MNEKQLLPTDARLGAVHLKVTDADRARLFWTRYVGLTEKDMDDGLIHLFAGDNELIVLHPGATSSVPRRSTGLYHVAIHVPDRLDLATLVARLGALEFPNAPTDHTSTMATYFDDPDGNGIEITFETPDRGEMYIDELGRPVARLHASGQIRGVTEALKPEELFEGMPQDVQLDTPLPAGTRIGHVHLNVNDIAASTDWYQDTVGFGLLLDMSRHGMTDFRLDQHTQPHSLAINSWNARGASPAGPDEAGIVHWSLLMPDRKSLDELADRARVDVINGAARITSPDGTVMVASLA